MPGSRSHATLLRPGKTCKDPQNLFLPGRLNLHSAGRGMAHRSAHIMPLRLTALEHLLARLNLLPVPLFDTPLAPGIAKVLVTACELGVFDVLDEHPLTLEALARRLQCNPQGLQLLLRLLVSAGYLRQRRGPYANTRMAQRWLT